MVIGVKTPASSANLGPGFDVLALALTLYDTVTLSSAESSTLTVAGEGAGKLDRAPEKNLALRSVRTFYERIGAGAPPLHVHMENSIPLSRGLGSSAAAIVGALVAANAYSGANLSRDDLFVLAVEMESHADNVAAALYGGLVIAYRQDEGFKVRQARPAANVGAALLVPESGLATAEARAVLPGEVPREEAVFNIGRSSLLVEALITGDLSVLRPAVEDALHQPWRRGLIPDYNITEYACYQAGARGVALSGAGPTLIAFYDKNDESVFKPALDRELAAAAVKRRVLFLDVDTAGAQVVSRN